MVLNFPIFNGRPLKLNRDTPGKCSSAGNESMTTTMGIGVKNLLEVALSSSLAGASQSGKIVCNITLDV